MRRAVVEIEKIIAEYAGNEVEAMRKFGGDRLANELLSSVACLFAARSISMIHIWSGEPVDSIRKRFEETMNHDLASTMRKFIKTIGKVE